MSKIDEDAAKLRVLADWFDDQDRKLGARASGDEVQQDLRRIADYLRNSVVVSPSRMASLVEDQEKLNALEAWGVDNWSGYDDAMRELRAGEES